MNFLITVFSQQLESDFGIECYKIHSERTKNTYLAFKNLNPILRKKMYNATPKIFRRYRNNSAPNVVIADIDDENYATVINTADIIIRNFYREHPIIDSINGNH